MEQLSDLMANGRLMTQIADVMFRITIVLLLGCVGVLLMRKQSAAFRHGWWLITLFSVVSVPITGVLLPSWGPQTPWLVQHESESPSNTPPTPTFLKTPDSHPAVTSREVIAMDNSALLIEEAVEIQKSVEVPGLEQIESAESNIASTSVNVTAEPQATEFLRFPPLLFGCWFGVAVLLLLYTIAGLLRVLRLVGTSKPITTPEWKLLVDDAKSSVGLNREVSLRESNNEIGPMTGGLWKSFILLPTASARWSVERRRVVLLHEMAHAKRRDVLSLWCARIVGALLWFHPLMWILTRGLRIERERACDDLVLKCGTLPTTYSQHLIEIAASYRASDWVTAVAMTMAGKSQLQNRIESVLDERQNRQGMTRRSTVVLVLLSFTLAATIATAGRVIIKDKDGNIVASIEVPPGGTVVMNGTATASTDAAGSNSASKEWLQWGGSAKRNNVSSATNLPLAWDQKSGENIHWIADLGSQTYGTPVVADGRVFIGTNNGHGYVKRYPGKVDLGCLLCFDENTGEFLWQHSSAKLDTGRANDWPLQGVASTPVVHGNRLFYVTNRAVVTCLDTNGHHDGNNAGPVRNENNAIDEADVVWEYDLIGELNVFPRCISGCSPTTDGKHLFVMTSNGVDESGDNVPSPNAPAFICLDLKTGKLLWSIQAAFANRDCQLSGPAIGRFDGETQVIFPGGDGWVYAFAPEGDGRGNSRMLWKFDCNPKDADYQPRTNGRKNLHVSMPVIHNGLVYVATGQNPEVGEGPADLWCIRPKSGANSQDVSQFLVHDKNDRLVGARVHANFVHANGDKLIPNPDSAVVWHYTSKDLNKDGEIQYNETFHRTWGSPVVHNGLVVISDFAGIVHCLDAVTGEIHWAYDLLAATWGTPLVADGRIYVGDEDGDVAVLSLSKELKELAENNCRASVYGTPIAVGNTMFVVTNGELLALRKTPPKNRGKTAKSNRRIREPRNVQRELNSTNQGKGNSPAIKAKTSAANPQAIWKRKSNLGWIAPATIVARQAYAGSLDGELSCLDLNTGTDIWSFYSAAGKDRPGFVTKPLVTANSVYIGDEDGVFHAIDRVSGMEEWSFTAKDQIGGAAIDGNRIFVASHDNNVYCMTLDGQILWTFAADNRLNSAPVVVSNHVVVAGCDEYLRVINVQDGTEVSKVKLNSPLVASPTVVGDRAFLGTYEGNIISINWRTGNEVWRSALQKVSIHAELCVTGEQVLVGGHDKKVDCVEITTGNRLWTFRAAGNVDSSAVAAANLFYFGSNDGNIYGVEGSTGKQVWKANVGRKITAGLSATNGYLVVGEDARNGLLHCFRIEE